MEGERGRGGKSQISRAAEHRDQPIPEPRSPPAGGGAADGDSRPAGTERGWRGTRGREKGSEARKGSQKGGKGRERAREEGGGGQRNPRRAMCRYWELGAFRFSSLGEGRGCSGLFLSSAFSSPPHSPLVGISSIFPFETLSGKHQACLSEVALLSFSNGGRGGKGWGALKAEPSACPWAWEGVGTRGTWRVCSESS